MDQDYVVVVDDDPDDLLLANLALQQCGCPFPVRLVSSGTELIHLLTTAHPQTGTRTLPPRLILLDLRMPGLSGQRVLERLRSDPALRSIPVIVMSGSLDGRAGSETIEAGADTFISKNLPGSEFKTALRDALCRHLVLPGPIRQHSA